VLGIEMSPYSCFSIGSGKNSFPSLLLLVYLYLAAMHFAELLLLGLV
jgi:hypothetical protein